MKRSDLLCHNKEDLEFDFFAETWNRIFVHLKRSLKLKFFLLKTIPKISCCLWECRAKVSTLTWSAFKLLKKQARQRTAILIKAAEMFTSSSVTRLGDLSKFKIWATFIPTSGHTDVHGPMLLKLYRQASIKVQKQRSGELKLWSFFSSILYNRKIRFIGSYTRLGLRFISL